MNLFRTSIKITVLLLVLLGAMLSCSNGTASTTTIPKPEIPKGYEESIIFYGDSRKHHDVHIGIVNTITGFLPKAVFHLGDAVSDGANETEWEMFDSITENLRTLTPFYPVIGNHEKGVDPVEYVTRWEMPIGRGYYSLDLKETGELVQLPISYSGETEYSQTAVDEAAVHLVVLTSMPGYLDEGGDQHSWLINDLLQYQGKPVILIFHIGLYMAGVHADETGENHATPVLYDIVSDPRFNIIACINGHDHAYQRFIVDNTQHIVTGCAGESPIDLVIPDHEDLVTSAAVHHLTVMQLVEENGGELNLKFTAFDSALNQLDQFIIDLE